MVKSVDKRIIYAIILLIMNYKANLPNFVSVSDLQRDYASLLKVLVSQGNPLYVLKKNKLQAVLVAPSFFETLIEKAKIYEEKEALKALRIYKKEKKAKKIKKLENVNELFE